MQDLSPLSDSDIKAVSAGATISCCEWNLFGLSISADVFSYNLNMSGAMSSRYGYDLRSAYNRL